MPPKISVVIPTYNNAALLCETLDGVRRQTFKDFEIIVVDDGSKDNTGDVVASYDSTIHYLQQSNQGPAAARNKGVSLAQGEFIAFCDHDDIWNERHLEKLLGCFTTHPSAAMVFDDAQYYGDGIAEEKTHIDAKVLQSLVGKEVPIRRIWQCWVASMSVVMVRKSVFNELGGLHPGIWGLDDLHFYLRLGVRHEVRYVNYVGCRKRLTRQNLLPKVGFTGLIECLEDLQEHHPEVVRAIGSVRFRTRLARKYHKLATRYLKEQKTELVLALLWKAYKENVFNLYYLWEFLMTKRRKNLVSYGR